MLHIRSHVGVAILIVLVSLSFACGGGGESAESEARNAEWAALETEHRALTDARAELVDLRVQLIEAQTAEAAEPAEDAEDGEEAEESAAEEGAMEEGAVEETVEPSSAEELQAKVEKLESMLTTMADDFGNHLVEFINADPVYQGEEPTERQKAAFRLKSSEDILLGQEYIDKGGDYRRAIDIFEAALMVDTDNPDIMAALEQAKANRYMTEERFSQVSESMSDIQVRMLLGQVNHINVREYPEKEVIAWFYPKDPESGGGAAAVYFQMHKASETYQVYRVDFEAVKAATEGEEEVEEEAPTP